MAVSAQTYHTPGDVPPSTSDKLALFKKRAQVLLREEKHWFLVLIPLLLTLFAPMRWLVETWHVSSDALGFQPFVPLGVLYLAWAERSAIIGTYHGLAEVYPDDHKMRRGTPLVVYLGCALLLLSYVVTIELLALIGFWITIIGIVLYMYGFTVLRTLWRPFLFAGTMLTPPHVLIDTLTAGLQRGCAAVAGAILKLFFPQTNTIGNFITIGSYTAQVSGPCSGVGILLPVLVLTLFLALLRQMRWTITLILLGLATGISLLMNTVRIVMMGVIGVQNPALAESLHDANSVVFTALAFYLTFLVAGRIGPRTYQDFDDEETEEEAQ